MNRIVLFIFLLLPFSLGARSPKKTPAPPTVEEILADLRPEAPAFWPVGMPFVHVSDRVSIALIPEGGEGAPSLPVSTSPRGLIWHFAGMVAEEDWMGQQILQLRFSAPDGRVFRYNTGCSLAAMADTSFLPIIDGLYPLPLIRKADSLLHARTFYININDERVIYADTLVHRKFVSVQIDSISYGSEQAPLRVCFSSADGSGYFFSSLPESRETATSTPIQRFLSATDPQLQYPNIAPETWQLIQQSRYVADMTTEEVRLAIGRPIRFERVTTRIGIIERWFYANSRVLEFLDGRLQRAGRER